MTQCYIYQLLSINELNENMMVYPFEDKCLNNLYGLKVEYSYEKEEFIFSCLYEGGGVQLIIFNKDLTEGYEPNFRLINCENIKGYSIIYISSLNDYYILSDSICNEEECSFKKVLYNPLEKDYGDKNEVEKKEEEKVEEEKKEKK